MTDPTAAEGFRQIRAGNYTRVTRRAEPMTTSECRCPSFVIQCVHNEHGVSAIVDRERLSPEARQQWIRATDLRYYISGVGEFDSEDAARTAFWQREAGDHD